MLVAKLTHDHLENRKGELEFTMDGFLRYWGAQNMGDYTVVLSDLGMPLVGVLDLPHTEFKLYDDDNELYYSGWLKDDPAAMVQQFVLAWAMADSGCTTIKVKIGNEWKQVIG